MVAAGGGVAGAFAGAPAEGVDAVAPDWSGGGAGGLLAWAGWEGDGVGLSVAVDCWLLLPQPLMRRAIARPRVRKDTDTRANFISKTMLLSMPGLRVSTHAATNPSEAKAIHAPIIIA